MAKNSISPTKKASDKENSSMELETSIVTKTYRNPYFNSLNVKHILPESNTTENFSVGELFPHNIGRDLRVNYS